MLKTKKQNCQKNRIRIIAFNNQVPLQSYLITTCENSKYQLLQ